MAAGLVLVMLMLAMAGHSSATWCVCKEGVNETSLQKSLDYACGAGADCTSIHQNGACFNPNTVKAHCSYAVNSYFQKKGQAVGSCDFSGSAIVVTSDPSTTGCVYPASASATTPTQGTTNTTPTQGTTTTPNTPSTGTATPTINTPTGTSPLITTPSSSGTGTGLGAGINNGGLGPSGTDSDVSDANTTLLPKNWQTTLYSLITTSLLWSVFL